MYLGIYVEAYASENDSGTKKQNKTKNHLKPFPVITITQLKLRLRE